MSRILDAVDESFVDLMTVRIKQALLDAGSGFPHEEIKRRCEVDETDADQVRHYRTAFAKLLNAGDIARTSCGWKRAENPWRK